MKLNKERRHQNGFSPRPAFSGMFSIHSGRKTQFPKLPTIEGGSRPELGIKNVKWNNFASITSVQWDVLEGQCVCVWHGAANIVRLQRAMPLAWGGRICQTLQ